jgi:predicted dehydrogenase
LKQVRIGVIGLGRMGQHHCRIYSNQKDAQLVGVFDIDQKLTNETSAKFDLHAYRRLDDLLDQVDAVTISTPTPTHFDISMRCIERNIHVLVEKPVTDKAEYAEIIGQSLKNKNLIFQVGHIERFNPTYIELKKVLSQLDTIAINFRRLSPYRVSNTDVDVVLDLMVHDLDLSNDITGKEPDKIAAFGLMPFSTTLDHVVAQLYYAGNPLINLTASRVTEQKIRSVEVTTTDTYIEADFMNKSICMYSGSRGEFLGKNRNGVSYRQESTIERILVPNIEPLAAEIQSFLDCIIHNHIPRVSISDGLSALRLANKISALSDDQTCLQLPHIPLEVSREELSQ